MTWERALAYAIMAAAVTGRHYYVYGYRTSLGRWRYGPYLVRYPNNGRIWP